MELHEQLRHHANTLRTNSMPLADLIPLLQKAADRIEELDNKFPFGQATVFHEGSNKFYEAMLMREVTHDELQAIDDFISQYG